MHCLFKGSSDTQVLINLEEWDLVKKEKQARRKILQKAYIVNYPKNRAIKLNSLAANHLLDGKKEVPVSIYVNKRRSQLLVVVDENGQHSLKTHGNRSAVLSFDTSKYVELGEYQCKISPIQKGTLLIWWSLDKKIDGGSELSRFEG